MNSGTLQDAFTEKQETGKYQKFDHLEFALSNDQYAIIQHYLPKGYSLLQKRIPKRDKNSAHKFADQENLSRISGAGIENTEEDQGRSKRPRPKKTDRFLEDEVPKISKRALSEKLVLDDEMSHCQKILHFLKKNQNSYPFMEPVDPKKTGASNYFEIIKEPMDFSTIERTLKVGGYQTANQFHADINKIWFNSYAYNEKTSRIYKITVDMQKYYKKLLENPSKKPVKIQKTKTKSKVSERDSQKFDRISEKEREQERSVYFGEKQFHDNEFQMDFDE